MKKYFICRLCREKVELRRMIHHLATVHAHVDSRVEGRVKRFPGVKVPAKTQAKHVTVDDIKRMYGISDDYGLDVDPTAGWNSDTKAVLNL